MSLRMGHITVGLDDEDTVVLQIQPADQEFLTLKLDRSKIKGLIKLLETVLPEETKLQDPSRMATLRVSPPLDLIGESQVDPQFRMGKILTTERRN